MSTRSPVKNHNNYNKIVSKKLHVKPELVFPVIFCESQLQLNYHVSNSTETALELSHIYTLTETSHVTAKKTCFLEVFFHKLSHSQVDASFSVEDLENKSSTLKETST